MFDICDSNVEGAGARSSSNFYKYDIKVQKEALIYNKRKDDDGMENQNNSAHNLVVVSMVRGGAVCIGVQSHCIFSSKFCCKSWLP